MVNGRRKILRAVVVTETAVTVRFVTPCARIAKTFVNTSVAVVVTAVAYLGVESVDVAT
jgi:hypothetical protein